WLCQTRSAQTAAASAKSKPNMTLRCPESSSGWALSIAVSNIQRVEADVLVFWRAVSNYIGLCHGTVTIVRSPFCAKSEHCCAKRQCDRGGRYRPQTHIAVVRCPACWLSQTT